MAWRRDGHGAEVPLGRRGARGVERGKLPRVEVDVQASRGAAFGFFKGGVVRVSVPAGLVESLGAVGRAIALRLGRHGGWRVMRATRFRGTSPPSPRDAVCGLWRRPLYYSAGFGTRAGRWCRLRVFFLSVQEELPKFWHEAKRRNKAPVASDIISTRSAT